MKTRPGRIACRVVVIGLVALSGGVPGRADQTAAEPVPGVELAASVNLSERNVKVEGRRTLAVVRYHTHQRGIPMNLDIARGIPTLFMAGGRDTTAGVDDAETRPASGDADPTADTSWLPDEASARAWQGLRLTADPGRPLY